MSTLLDATPLTYSAALAQVRRLRAPDKKPIRVAVGGNCNVDYLIPGLRVALNGMGTAAEVVATPYDGWIASALAGDLTADVWLLWHSAMGASLGGIGRRQPDIDSIVAATRRLTESGRQVVFVLPEALAAETEPSSPFRVWRVGLQRALEESLPPAVVRIDATMAQVRVGASKWFAPRYWTLAKAPCHPDGATEIGRIAGRTIAQLLRPAIKAVVADLDDTLWGGLVGEVGPHGVDLDAGGLGRAYLEMQQFLKDLIDIGIPVCIASKNDREIAESVFAERQEMRLTLADVLYSHISWEPKYKAIRQVAADLNVGLDSICFIDDSSHERAEARAMVPELLVPEIPGDPEARVAFLRDTLLFIAPAPKSEDRLRVQSYRAEAHRRTLREQAADHHSYLSGLGMQLAAEPVGATNLARVVALVQKTNQFNATGRRHGNQAVGRIASDGDAFAFSYRLADRFGDAGQIAVLMAIARGERVEIDTWVMSCRVFSRGVEDAMLAHLIGWARARGASTIEVPFEPTDRNRFLPDLFVRQGFAGDSEGRLFRRPVAPSAPSHHLSLTSSMQAAGIPEPSDAE